MFSIRSSVALCFLAVALAACQTPAPPPTPPLPKPPVAQPQPKPAEPAKPAATPLLTPTQFSALPGWTEDAVNEAWPAFLASCSVLAKQATWKEVCANAHAVQGSDAAAVRNYFESYFTPHLVRAADGADAGLITGYYEAMLQGARKRGGAYQTPLYKVPDDLITVDLASLYPDLKGMRLRGRLVGKKLIPYGSRAEIEQAPLAGKELLWVDDPVEAFFLEVQGSGRVYLADTQETVRVSYADQNGHPYKSIGRWLLEKGELKLEQASAQGIKAWIEANPARKQELFNANPSFVFFREERLPDPSVGPKGSLGVPLTPARSVAIDPAFIQLGAPIFLATTEANSAVPMQRLVMGQDTGGAIRGAIRADFFFGFGHQAAENAGHMKQRGQVWVLLPKN